MIPEPVRANVEKLLNEKGVDRNCPACKRTFMKLFDYPFLVPMRGTTDAADFYALMYDSCSHTMFFSFRPPSLLKKWADNPQGWTEGGTTASQSTQS